jgi:hypothetical protein
MVHNIQTAVVLIQPEKIVERHTKNTAEEDPVYSGMSHYSHPVIRFLRDGLKDGPGAVEKIMEVLATRGAKAGRIQAPGLITAGKSATDLVYAQALPFP